MLSYQHAYHAGNLADVHKHALLAVALARLADKPKPLSYLETHAGRGLYDLRAPEALRAITGYRWPGNVRELQNRIQRATIMAEGKRVGVADLELSGAVELSPPQTLKGAREAAEREIVTDTLRRHGGKITSAALELGISRPTLYELMEKLGIGKA